MLLVLPLLSAALAACPARAQSVTLPPKLTAAVGEMGSLTVPWDGASIRFDGDRSLNVSREFTDDPKECVLRYFSMKPGEFVLRAVVCKGDKLTAITRCVVTVGDLPPIPPTPPTPPVPPVPPVPPTPPLPDDPVATRLKAAIKTDPDAPADKLASCKTLSAFFSAMAAHAKDPTIKTVGDLLSDYRAAIPSVLKTGAIPAVRKQIASEVAAITGADPATAIDPALRDKLIALFELLATILQLLS